MQNYFSYTCRKLEAFVRSSAFLLKTKIEKVAESLPVELAHEDLSQMKRTSR